MTDVARKIGTALVAIGLAGVAGWAWIMWRAIDYLNNPSDDSFSNVGVFVDSGTDAGAGDYADAFAQGAYHLMFAAAVVGIGMIVRVLADRFGPAVAVAAEPVEPLDG